jgi:cytochrome c-type biogenesis protein CcmH/NrfF
LPRPVDLGVAPVAWPLWLAPIVLLAAGALLVLRRLRSREGR